MNRKGEQCISNKWPYFETEVALSSAGRNSSLCEQKMMASYLSQLEARLLWPSANGKNGYFDVE